MSEAKHTPGPWLRCHHLQSAEKDASCPCGFPGDIWGGDQEAVVCSIGSHCGYQGWEMVPRYDRATELANARLISAAPEMYHALKQLTGWYTQAVPEGVWELVAGAIAKAEGVPQ